MPQAISVQRQQQADDHVLRNVTVILATMVLAAFLVATFPAGVFETGAPMDVTPLWTP